MFNNDLVLVGYFKEIHELADRLGEKITAIIDPLCDVEFFQDIVLYGNDNDFLINNVDRRVFITPDLPNVRQKLYGIYKNQHQLITLACPTAMISPSATIGDGCCIQSNVYVSSGVNLGHCVKLNVNANVMHDSKVGHFATIAPNAVLLGGVNIGQRAYIGANATILPGIRIGDGVIVGAGSVVTKNVPDGLVICGNPARILR